MTLLQTRQEGAIITQFQHGNGFTNAPGSPADLPAGPL